MTCRTSHDPYEGKVKLGRIVLDAAHAAIHDDSNTDLARINAILACETFIATLASAGCMVTRIPNQDVCQTPELG